MSQNDLKVRGRKRGNMKSADDMIQMKRAYEAASKSDGYRVLIDRLWPRGIKKENLTMDEWARVLSPSSLLRHSFSHQADRWGDFKVKYREELSSKEAQAKLNELANRALVGRVTLLYSARDEEHNDAVVLKQILKRKIAGKKNKVS